MNWIIYYNQERFQLDQYGTTRIESYSTIRNIQTDQRTPQWINTVVNKNQLGDEIGYVQWGDEEEIEFNSVTFDPPRPSAWTEFPSKE